MKIGGRLVFLLFLGIRVAAEGSQDIFATEELLATVTTTDGSVHEVRNFAADVERDRWHFNDRWACCFLATDAGMEIAIPLVFVSNIECKGARCIATYTHRGVERKIEAPAKGRWKGKGRSGDVALEANRVRSVRLSGPTPEPLIWGLGNHSASVLLADGTTVEATHLLAVFESREAIRVGGLRTGSRTRRRHDDGFWILRDGHRAIGFDQLSKVEFLPARQISASSRDGRSTTVDIDDWREELVGFSGESEKGYFYVPYRTVKSISFVPPAQK